MTLLLRCLFGKEGQQVTKLAYSFLQLRKKPKNRENIGKAGSEGSKAIVLEK